MKYVSTRGNSPAISFSEALRCGPAPDGGLYVPESIPTLDVKPGTLAEVARQVLAPFLEGDPLHARIEALTEDAFSFPAPLVELTEGTELLLLDQGPTCAFKDYGARFLAACLSGGSETRTVLVATSGDTGAAVAAAFHGRPGFRVVVLFPLGRISERQRRQLCGFGGNVEAIAVRGTFDDCQRIVKSAFADARLAEAHRLVSANSISVGRWLPQAAYFAAASLDWTRRHGAMPGIVVPSGNLGNGVAACLAMRMGLPIREVVLAFNENDTVPRYFSDGVWTPIPTRATPANAMDVAEPSNFERLRWLYPEGFANLSAVSISSPRLLDVVARAPRELGRPVCPHTAVGLAAREDRPGGFIVAATAHPAKFEEVIEPLIGRPVEVPLTLRRLIDREGVQHEIAPELAELARVLDQ